MTELVSFASGLVAGMLILWIMFLLTGRATTYKPNGPRPAEDDAPDDYCPPPRPKNRTMWMPRDEGT
jgi:hypothetical protein